MLGNATSIHLGRSKPKGPDNCTMTAVDDRESSSVPVVACEAVLPLSLEADPCT